MFRRLSRFTPEIFAATYILAGALFACDGLQKLLGAVGGLTEPDPPAIARMAGAIEVCGGALIAARSRALRRLR